MVARRRSEREPGFLARVGSARKERRRKKEQLDRDAQGFVDAQGFDAGEKLHRRVVTHDGFEESRRGFSREARDRYGKYVARYLVARYGEAPHDDAFAQRQHARARRLIGWQRRKRRRLERLGGAILELQAGKARVETSTRAERPVRPFLDDSALVHHDDSVGCAHGR